MKPVTIVLQILSIITFILMCLSVYWALEGYWNWNAPYVFIVTVFRLISLLLFFLASMVIAGLVAPFTNFAPGEALVGLYNTQLLRMWYMQPYGVTGPFYTINDVFASVMNNMGSLWIIFTEYSFNFLSDLCGVDYMGTWSCLLPTIAFQIRS